MILSKLAVVMSDRCTAACDMCCFSCSPRGQMHLETGMIKDIMHQASEVEGIRSVGFTGGEPLIYFDQLLECCEYAKTLGLRTTINTNGYWGADEKKALEKATRLHDAGVELISFSADRYHQQYVPLEHLRMAIKATKEAGMGASVSVMETKSSVDIEKTVEGLRPEIYSVDLSYHPMLPVGKAMETVEEGDFIQTFKSASSKCAFNGLFQLNFDGNYYLCCSQFCREIPLINLGSADKVPLKDLERRILSNDYLYVMLRNGLDWYIDQAREFGFEIPEYVCSACHSCYLIFRNQKFLEQVRELVEKEAGRLRLQHLLRR